jgi:hypothetical protein
MFSWLQNNWLILLIAVIPLAVVLALFFLRLNRDVQLELKPDMLEFKIPKKPVDFTIFSTVGNIYVGKAPQWYEVLRQELDRLPLGKVVFNPPDTMQVGVKERIETRISRDLSADLVTSLKGRGVPEIEELKISELMKVRLSGDDFDIIPQDEEEQIIEQTGFTEWAWDVTPRKSGKKIIHLHVILRIILPFGEEKKDYPVLDREIAVKVNLGYSVKSFIFANWKWIVTALILPLIGWLIKSHIK